MIPAHLFQTLYKPEFTTFKKKKKKLMFWRYKVNILTPVKDKTDKPYDQLCSLPSHRWSRTFCLSMPRWCALCANWLGQAWCGWVVQSRDLCWRVLTSYGCPKTARKTDAQCTRGANTEGAVPWENTNFAGDKFPHDRLPIRTSPAGLKNL